MSEATKATHTPGPWRTSGEMRYISSKSGYVPIRTPFRDKAFSDGPERSNYSEDELSANARLIAAAPELLAACEMMADLDACNDSRDRLELFDAKYGVAPAKGRYNAIHERIRAAIAKARS